MLLASIYFYVYFKIFQHLSRESSQVPKNQPTLPHQRDQTGGHIWPTNKIPLVPPCLKRFLQNWKFGDFKHQESWLFNKNKKIRKSSSPQYTYPHGTISWNIKADARWRKVWPLQLWSSSLLIIYSSWYQGPVPVIIDCHNVTYYFS